MSHSFSRPVCYHCCSCRSDECWLACSVSSDIIKLHPLLRAAFLLLFIKCIFWRRSLRFLPFPPFSSPFSASSYSNEWSLITTDLRFLAFLISFLSSHQIPHVKIGPEETPRLPYLRFASVTLYPSNEDLSLAIGAILRSFSYPSASLVCAKAECKYMLRVV